MSLDSISGDSHSSFEPRKIDGLCKKRIVDVAFGSGPHVLAVSESRHLIVFKVFMYAPLK